MGTDRTPDQDPRYGFQVLGEIAARALSPGINDPVGARDVLARTVCLVECWIGADAKHEPRHDRVTIRPLPLMALLEEALLPIARHGAANPVVQPDLQSGLRALSGLGDPELADASRRLSAAALDYALPALATGADRERVRLAASRTRL